MWQGFVLRQYRRFIVSITGCGGILPLRDTHNHVYDCGGRFGVNTKQSTTYQLFMFLFVLLVFSWVNSAFNRLKVTLTRKLPRYGMVASVKL